MEDCQDFKEVDHDCDDNFLFALEVVGNTKKQLMILNKKSFSVGILEKSRECHQGGRRKNKL